MVFVKCFGLVENFAQNFLNRIDYYKSELMKTNYDLKESENDISHLFCKLGNLSNDHFIENVNSIFLTFTSFSIKISL